MDKAENKYFDLAFEYHVAAVTLHTQIFETPYLYNPTSYLLRHTIELLLKGLIIKSRPKKIAINDIKIGKDKMNAIHSVLLLWNHYKSINENLSDVETKSIDKALKKLNQKDFSSTRYRYPYKKNGTPLPLEPVAFFDKSGIAPDLELGIPYIIQNTEQVAVIEKGRLLIQDISMLFDVTEMLFRLSEV